MKEEDVLLRREIDKICLMMMERKGIGIKRIVIKEKGD